MRAEMEDWYFSPAFASSAGRPRSAQKEPVFEPVGRGPTVEPALEPYEFDVQVGPPGQEPKRRSPYAVDLRNRVRSAGRPQSMPPCLAAAALPQRSATADQVRRKAGGQRSADYPESEAHAAAPSGKPSIGIIAKAASEVPQQGTLPESKQPPSAAAGEGEKFDSNAINDWLVQAQDRVAALAVPAAGLVKETSPEKGAAPRPESAQSSGSSTSSLTAAVPVTSTGPAAAPSSAAPAAAKVGLGSSPSDSDDYSDDDAEDSGDKDLDLTGVDAAVTSDRGSGSSLSFDDAPAAAPAQVERHASVASTGSMEDVPDVIANVKVETATLGATAASLSYDGYDEDFAPASEEEDTLGASIGGA